MIRGNDSVKKQLQIYVQSKAPQPLLLYGPQGIGKRNLAEQVAAGLIGCQPDELLKQPEFYVYSGTMKVEDVKQMLQDSSQKARANVKVYLLDNVDLSTQSMNKLLKVLEEKVETNKFIFIRETALLPTIESRCITLHLQPLSFNEMKKFLSEQNIKEKDMEWYAFFSGHCPGRFLRKKQLYEDLFILFHNILSNRKDLLTILHMVEEKDTSCLYDIYKEDRADFLTMFQYLFYCMLKQKIGLDQKQELYEEWLKSYTTAQTLEILNQVGEAKKRIEFTKNDFFYLLCIISKN